MSDGPAKPGRLPDVSTAARRVFDDISTGNDVDPRALELLMGELAREVRYLFPDLDADDIVQSTVTRLLEKPERIAAIEIDNPWGYLITVTRNVAIDAIRRRKRRREVDLDEATGYESPDDAVASLIERDATHSAVVTAMRALIEAGDDVTIPIVTTWLDMADELGQPPSTREVAPRAGVSHTTVAQALKRFRQALGRRL